MTDATMATKLGIGPGTRLWFEPIEWLNLLGPLPAGASTTGEFATATVAVMFASDAGSMRWFLDRYRTVMTRPLALWICYPTLGRPDFNRATLQTMLAGHGLLPQAQVTIDSAWTALRVGRVATGPAATR